MKQGAKLKVFFCILLIAAAVLFVKTDTKNVQAAAQKYTVKFVNPNGNISTHWYQGWTDQYKNGVTSGTTITLPVFSSKTSKNFWVVKKGSNEIVYNHGAKVKITEDTTFYMKYCKYYTVKFYTPSGAGEFTSLQVKAYDTQTISLPSSPKKDNSERKSTGWSTGKNRTGTKYSFKGNYKVSGDVSFYLYTTFHSDSKVNLYTKGGYFWQTIDNSSGTATFPEIAMNSANMFLGWSTKKGQYWKPQFYAGDTIPNKTGKYYMVVFTSSNETTNITSKTPSQYHSVYFVGDSRTTQMQWAAQNHYYTLPSNIQFVAKGGAGIGWFMTYGSVELEDKLKQRDKNTDRIAIIINLGVNNMNNPSEYVEYFNSYAQKLINNGYSNIDFYYMSINPINATMIYNSYATEWRSDSKIQAFNSTIKTCLCSGEDSLFTYIDTYNYFRRFGWISNAYAKGRYDGLHYSPATMARIYNVVMINYLCK